jgi:hypothetical protein
MGEVAEWPNAAAFFLKVVTPVSRRRGFESLPSPLAGSASVNGQPFVTQSRCCLGAWTLDCEPEDGGSPLGKMLVHSILQGIDLLRIRQCEGCQPVAGFREVLSDVLPR